MSISLGTCDAGCAPAVPATYFAPLHEGGMTANPRFRGEQDGQWIGFTEQPGDEVRTLQQFLKDAGFFPFGKIDGICGYRTTGSLRLFQEYVRSVEKDASIGAADGLLGEKTQAHVQRWRAGKLKANWLATTSANPTAEYVLWMNLLGKVKERYRGNVPTLLQDVIEYTQPTDTVKPADWSFDPQRIHLVGVRRAEAQPGTRMNDDVYVLLINGVTFKFFGTTDPGKSSNASGAPFLVPGQHRYRFGWHKLSDMDHVYRALKPAGPGVLVIRDGDRDDALTEADLAGRLEANNSINVHWGGKGTSNWSEGCQVICGRGYINHERAVVDCSAFAASQYGQLGTRVGGVYLTKGAYSVLVDLVTAFSADVYAVDYMLLYERDLELEPALGAQAARDILLEITA